MLVLWLFKFLINVNVGVDFCVLFLSDYVLVRVVMVVEFVGFVFFVCGYVFGVKMLILFTLSVSFAMYSFWRSASEVVVLGDEVMVGIEMIMFFKNIVFVGVLMFWLGM